MGLSEYINPSMLDIYKHNHRAKRKKPKKVKKKGPRVVRSSTHRGVVARLPNHNPSNSGKTNLK